MDGSMGAGATHAHHETSISGWARLGNFARHFGEMCLAMCLGLAVLDVVYGWVAGLFGYTNPYWQFPVLSALVLAFNMTAPMVAWMRFRGMAWRPIWEMSAAMVVEALVLIGGYSLGVLANAEANGLTTLWWLQHGLMMPVMLIPMLLRLDLYAGGTHHHAHAA